MNRKQQKEANKPKEVLKNLPSEDGKNLSASKKIDWLRNVVEQQRKVIAEHEGRLNEMQLLIGLCLDADDPEGALREYALKMKAWVNKHAQPKVEGKVE